MNLRLPLIAAGVAILAQTVPADAATYYFIRHAESTANTGEAKTPEEMVDPMLTALGQQQTLDLVNRLDGVNLTNIYVSSYKRTGLTIYPTASSHGLATTTVDAIKEWSFGDADLNDPNFSSKFGAMFGAWAKGDTGAKLEGAPASESLDELNARVIPAYMDIINRHKNEDGVVAMVGHGGSIGWTMPTLTENVTLSYALGNGLHNTAIVKVEFGDDGKLYVTEWDGKAFDRQGPVAPVPLPAGAFLLISALGGLGVTRALSRRASA
ncbi:MAG: histidine phosphatase family protein [Pikeienuella sp.]